MSTSANISPDDPNDGQRGWWVVLGSVLAFWLWYRWRSDSGDGAGNTPSSIQRGYEDPDDVSVGGVLASGVALLVVIGLCLAVLVGLYAWFAEEDAAPSRFADERRVPPTPRLQSNPAAELAEVRRRSHERLHSYGWVDPANDVVHIPIERAMTLVAERGLPHDATATADTARRVLSESGVAWEKRGPPPPSAPAYVGTTIDRVVPPSTPVWWELPLDTLSP